MSTRFAEALAYAVDAHETQPRKGTAVPYLAHLLAVSGLVLEAGGTQDQAIAALLHDTAEDQPLEPRDGMSGGQVRVEDIRARFGDDVALMVEHLSDTLDKHNERRPWCQRKQDYLTHLAGSAGSPHLLISVADKLHNCRSVVRDLRASDGDVNSVWGRFSGRRTGTCWYYENLRRTYVQVGATSILLDQFTREVDALLDIAGLDRSDVPLQCPQVPAF